MRNALEEQSEQIGRDQATTMARAALNSDGQSAGTMEGRLRRRRVRWKGREQSAKEQTIGPTL